MHINFRRTGGIGGSMKPLTLRVGEPSAEERAAWDEAVRSGALEALEAPPPPPTAADDFQYEITVRQGDDEQVVRFTDSAMPESLYPLVSALERRAQDEERRSSGR